MIPPIAHFIWFGPAFPWANVLAIQTCLRNGDIERAVLHCDHDLSATPHWHLLADLEGFEVRPIDPEAIFAATPGGRGGALMAIFEKLTQPAARANMTRAALLAAEGGVYLDTDTITVASLTPLRQRSGAFCGLEHIALPVAVATSRSPLTWALAGARIAARDLFRRLPGGWRPFRLIEPLYPTAANNAVLASTAGHPFLLDMLDRMIATPPERQLVRFALGTHLLQQALTGDATDDVVACNPTVFYPIGPEISEHWFRPSDQPGHDLDEALRDDTRVVHWYASVRTREIVPQLNPDYIHQNRHRQMFSLLACRALGLAT
ncbi:MAG: glycosyl transferase [Myxococcales bacterium]|nr:glycosyl transferase [Myxococcales bacterium]